MCFSLFFLFLAQTVEVDFERAVADSEWDIKEDAEKGIYDAVILEQTTYITTTAIKHYRRIRVLSERGAASAELTDISNRSRGIEGRVIDADGSVTPFRESTDLIETLGYRLGRDKEKTKILVPPGLTRDCIVEMSWREPAEDGLPLRTYSKRYVIPDDFYCLKKTIVLTNTVMKRQTGYFPTRFMWTQIAAPAEFEQSEKGGDKIFTYRNVPALRREPFGNAYMDPAMAYVLTYKTFPDYGRDPQVFWSDFGKGWVRSTYGVSYATPGQFDQWLKGLQQELKGQPIEDALMVYAGFLEKYRTEDFLTPAERAAVKEKVEIENNRLLLSTVEKAGYTPSYYLSQILYKVFEDLGLEPYVVFAGSVTGAPFRMEEMNPFVLDIHHPLVALKLGEDQWLAFSPSDPHYPPGVVPSIYRGQNVVGFGKVTKWKPVSVALPRLNWESHLALRSYTMSIASSGEAHFDAQERARGRMAASLRGRYFNLPQDERDQYLRSRWQRRARNWLIEDARVEGADSFGESIVCKVSGALTFDLEGDEWLAFNPFPGDRLIIDLDYEWEPDRLQPVILPSAGAQVDETRCVLPDGWSLMGDPSWEKRNGIGLVRFKATQEGNELVVKREIIFENSFLAPAGQPHLMLMSAWIDEAMSQTLAIGLKGDTP